MACRGVVKDPTISEGTEHFHYPIRSKGHVGICNIDSSSMNYAMKGVELYDNHDAGGCGVRNGDDGGAGGDVFIRLIRLCCSCPLVVIIAI